MKSASSAIQMTADRGLQPITVQTNLTVDLLEKNILKTDQDDLLTYFYSLAQAMPFVQSVYWGDKNGNSIVTNKDINKQITSTIYDINAVPHQKINIEYDQHGNILHKTVIIADSPDPRLANWYQAAKQRRQIVWSDIFNFLFYPYALGTGTIKSVYDSQGHFQGVFGLALPLDYLSAFINTQKINQDGFSFIINAKHELIAYPDIAIFIFAKNHPNKIIHLAEINSLLLQKAINKYNGTSQQDVVVYDHWKSYLVSFDSIPTQQKNGWVIVTMIPKNELIRPLLKLYGMALVISLIIFIIGIFLLTNLVTKIVQPLKKLVTETEKIKQFELDDHQNLRSRIKEIADLSSAIAAMKLGLKSFQKYVPKILVKQLIESGEDSRVGGERKSVVVLFSDIENFTTISEHAAPSELLVQVCEYFEEVSRIIVNHKGTIDKYIGDSIMAFWGAPLFEENGCIHAASAALECVDSIAQFNIAWQKQGKPAFITRFGIHTGDAIVGNVGSSWRLNYTALGDTVNITSRLEQINKEYHTQIIVSHAVYEKIKHQFVLRELGSVLLKGRGEESLIYELVGKVGS